MAKAREEIGDGALFFIERAKSKSTRLMVALGVSFILLGGAAYFFYGQTSWEFALFLGCFVGSPIAGAFTYWKTRGFFSGYFFEPFYLCDAQGEALGRHDPHLEEAYVLTRQVLFGALEDHMKKMIGEEEKLEELPPERLFHLQEVVALKEGVAHALLPDPPNMRRMEPKLNIEAANDLEAKEMAHKPIAAWTLFIPAVIIFVAAIMFTS